MENTEHGITVVMISREEFEKLLRESEQLAIIKRYIEVSTYPSVDDIRITLGIERKENEE